MEGPLPHLGGGLNLRRNKRKLVSDTSFRIIFHQDKRVIQRNVLEFLAKMRYNPIRLDKSSLYR